MLNIQCVWLPEVADMSGAIFFVVALIKLSFVVNYVLSALLMVEDNTSFLCVTALINAMK